MRTERCAWGLLLLSLTTSVVGCDRRGEEARPEPVSLARAAPQKAGTEHGQDPPSSPQAPRAARADRATPSPSEEAEETVAEDGREADQDRARKPAKRRRAGGVTSADRDEAGTSALRAKRLVVARSVDGREPVGIARSFDGSQVSEVAAFVELSNDAREATRIVVRFEPPTADGFEVPLEVGASPRWRTWATTRRPLEQGTWKVRVIDAEGATLASTTFEVME